MTARSDTKTRKREKQRARKAMAKRDRARARGVKRRQHNWGDERSTEGVKTDD